MSKWTVSVSGDGQTGLTEVEFLDAKGNCYVFDLDRGDVEMLRNMLSDALVHLDEHIWVTAPVTPAPPLESWAGLLNARFNRNGGA